MASTNNRRYEYAEATTNRAKYVESNVWSCGPGTLNDR